jgi:hypothetical protein
VLALADLGEVATRPLLEQYSAAAVAAVVAEGLRLFFSQAVSAVPKPTQ